MNSAGSQPPIGQVARIRRASKSKNGSVGKKEWMRECGEGVILTLLGLDWGLSESLGDLMEFTNIPIALTGEIVGSGVVKLKR